MLKRAAALAMVVSFLLLLTGMGGKGGGFERAPRVDKNFLVFVTDVSGTKIEGEKFSWEGRVRFSGYMGMAEVNLPFDKIRDVIIGEKRDRKVRVTAHLLDGSEALFDVDADSRCFGEARFGSFMLFISELKSISFKSVNQ
jgi:hypothetical protein